MLLQINTEASLAVAIYRIANVRSESLHVREAATIEKLCRFPTKKQKNTQG
ncbi:hypothetical protein TFUB20_02471 [Tannerella forsythia]|uniref:Uncharacterized protein n=1 Tax=Tannerella forsythia TaxID=28112 RepID=A0A1D3UWF9_TANFO|nr:hypothetical protein TFUB20_02471 [Tannerella forsythia]